MISSNELKEKIKELKPHISNKYFVDKIGYFGSYARNEQTEKSDIDIFVSFKKPLGWEFFDLLNYLELQLNLKVDLVTENALKKQLKQQILTNIIFV